ncbi:MAG: TetR family transcriptional regulator [Burkholderiales bacterium]|nr:TetR family transcriptional regulator [Burkholderiales bacterium]
MPRTAPADAATPEPANLSRRDALLRAAADVFAHRGYHGAGMRDIAAAWGAQPAAIYHYFPSKAALLEAICHFGITQFLDRLAAIQASDLAVETKVREAVRAHIEPLIEDRFYVQAFLFLRRELPDAARRPLDELSHRYEELWHALLVEGQTRGVIPKSLDRRISVLAILGMCNAVARWTRSAADSGLDPIATVFSQVLSYGLFGAPTSDTAAPARRATHRRKNPVKPAKPGDSR